MLGQRLIRLVLVVVGIVLLVGLVKAVVQEPGGFSAVLSSLSVPKMSLNKLGFKNPGQQEPVSGADQGEEVVVVLGEAEGEVEPIAAPVVNVQDQANTLLMMIRRLPEDQVKAVKKQLCKELCVE